MIVRLLSCLPTLQFLLMLQGCEPVAAAISGASFAKEMMNKMLESGHSFDEVLEKLQRHGLLPRNANL